MSTEARLLPGVGDRIRKASGTEYSDNDIAKTAALILGMAQSLFQQPSPPGLEAIYNSLQDNDKRIYLVNRLAVELFPAALKAGAIDPSKVSPFVDSMLDMDERGEDPFA